MQNIFHYKEGKIQYTSQGSGDTIILLHGYLESADVWAGFEKKLAPKFRVISVDLPGHGLSDIYEDTHTMDFMATVIKELLEYLNIDKVFLIGHSLGGYVALAFLESYPDYLSGYCLFHSQPFSDSPESLEKRRHEIDMVESGNKNLMYPDNVIRMFATSNIEKLSESVQRLKDIASRIPGEGIIAVLKGMMVRPSRLSLMEEGKVPCLWILGALDNYIPCNIIQAKVRLPENGEVVVLKNSGHLGFIEEEDKSVKVITDFIKKLQS